MGIGTLAVEAAYAVLRRVPVQEEFDVSGVLGPADGRPLLLVVLGDSTCTGPGLKDPSQIWCWLLASRIADLGHRVTVRSFAAGGATSSTVLLNQLPEAEKLRPDLTLIAVGTNDVARQVPLSSLQRNLDEIVRRMTLVSDRLLVAGVGDLGTVPRLLPPLRQFASRRGRRADSVQNLVARGHGALKVELWGVAAEAFRSDPAIFSDDLFHPAPLGHQVWADAAWKAVEPHLSR